MDNKVIVVDDTKPILEVKTMLLKESGFEVEGYEKPNEALLQLANQMLFGKHPYALVTDMDMQPFSGSILIAYVSPKTNRQNALIREGTMAATDINLYRTIQDYRKITEADGHYRGKTILTSRQKLEPQTIEDWISNEGKRQLAVLNEALQVSDSVFKIGADGKGMDELILYLRS